ASWTCDDPRRSCFIIGDIDGDSTIGAPGEAQTMPIIDCVTNTALVGVVPGGANQAHMFYLGNDGYTDDGWMTMQNIDWQCPKDETDDEADMIAVQTGAGSAGRLLLVNIKVPALKGTLNQVATSHNNGDTTIVAINTDCTIDDTGDDSVQCFYGLSGSYYVVGRTRLRSITATTGQTSPLKMGSGMWHLFVMGHQIECEGGASESGILVTNASNAIDTPFASIGYRRRTLVVADAHIEGCAGASGGAIYANDNTLPAGGGYESVINLFKVSLLESK
ncbi:unnamed protein product, partial [marine sediment metagenome]